MCMHHCKLKQGQTGLCRARSNIAGKVMPVNYGKITSYALDPVEKKPLRHFYPGSLVLSVGSYGCNLSCPFCQNHSISMIAEEEAEYEILMPEELVKEAAGCKNCIGIAYTYNEPLIGYEYVLDCSKRANEKGLKNVVVTNGCAETAILDELLPYIDAFNIDLKGFKQSFYKNIGGDLTTVKAFIKRAAEKSHVEITTLIIPDENDTLEEIIEIAKWLASIDENIPYHISRFFPQWKMCGKESTSVETIYRLAGACKKYLKNVYTGNC